jgi:hypothetical protein
MAFSPDTLESKRSRSPFSCRKNISQANTKVTALGHVRKEQQYLWCHLWKLLDATSPFCVMCLLQVEEKSDTALVYDGRILDRFQFHLTVCCENMVSKFTLSFRKISALQDTKKPSACPRHTDRSLSTTKAAAFPGIFPPGSAYQVFFPLDRKILYV